MGKRRQALQSAVFFCEKPPRKFVAGRIFDWWGCYPLFGAAFWKGNRKEHWKPGHFLRDKLDARRKLCGFQPFLSCFLNGELLKSPVVKVPFIESNSFYRLSDIVVCPDKHRTERQEPVCKTDMDQNCLGVRCFVGECVGPGGGNCNLPSQNLDSKHRSAFWLV